MQRIRPLPVWTLESRVLSGLGQKMAHRILTYKSSALTMHKALTEPDLKSRTVLVTDTWDYIDLWLRRNSNEKARFFWDQARHFAAATLALPKESAPLTAYYCMLNAVKTLLLVKNCQLSNWHGVSGKVVGDRTSISNEIVEFKASGILTDLCRHLGEDTAPTSYTLSNILYNLVYIHRAYTLSMDSKAELFVPVKNAVAYAVNGGTEAWMSFELEGRYANMKTLNKLPSIFEKDESFNDRFIIRTKKRFRWKRTDEAGNLTRFIAYHAKLRRDVYYIHSPQKLWYIKRNGGVAGHIGRSNLTLSFAAMHRLSELARYSPDILARHFEGRYNWLLSEFLMTSMTQFLDEISSEMTGHDFVPPGRA